MSEEHLDNFRALQQLPEDRALNAGDYNDDNGSEDIDIHNIMDGSTRIEISHAGGEFVATLQDGIEREMADMSTKYFFTMLLLLSLLTQNTGGSLLPITGFVMTVPKT
jgi:hypothetical protein